MKKSIKNLEVKEIKNVSSIKGGHKIGLESSESERTQIRLERRQ